MEKISYNLIRSDRKTMCIEIKRNCEIFVRVPNKATENEINKFVNSHIDWIVKKLALQKNRVQKETLERQEIEKLRQKAKEYIPQRVAFFADLMKLYPTGIKITSAKTRFGSCSGKNSICFSLYLMLYPLEAVDSVIVHELAHIKHHNHSPQFYCLIYKYMPDYKERQKILKKYSFFN